MRSFVALIALTSAVVGISLFGYVNHKLIPIGDTEQTMDANSSFFLTSTAFAAHASIPSQFTCDGAGSNPPLSISGTPSGTQSLALIMDDPDISQTVKDQMHITAFIHWVLFSIPPQTAAITTGDSIGTPGVSGSGTNGYTAPCPPPQPEPNQHRYVFTLFALDTTLTLKAGASSADVQLAMRGHILAQTQLIGLYKRK